VTRIGRLENKRDPICGAGGNSTAARLKKGGNALQRTLNHLSRWQEDLVIFSPGEPGGEKGSNKSPSERAAETEPPTISVFRRRARRRRGEHGSHLGLKAALVGQALEADLVECIGGVAVGSARGERAG